VELGQVTEAGGLAPSRIDHHVVHVEGGVDPVRDVGAVRTMVDDALASWEQRALAGAVARDVREFVGRKLW